MTNNDNVAGLCERLRARKAPAHSTLPDSWRDPLTLEAADTLERQAAEIERLNATCYLDSFMASERKVERQAAEIERLRGALERIEKFAIRAALTGEDA